MDLKELRTVQWNDLKKGTQLSLKNADRLARDAGFLIRDRRTASGVALLVAAWDELGKAVLLLKHWKNGQDVKWESDLKKIFRGHSAKQMAVFEHQQLLWPDRPFVHDAVQDQRLKSSLRWAREVLGLYVNWLGSNDRWSCPSNHSACVDAWYLSYSIDEYVREVTKQIMNTLAGESCLTRLSRNRRKGRIQRGQGSCEDTTESWPT